MVLLLSLSFGGGGGIKYEILRRKTKQHQKTTKKNQKTKIKKQKKKTTANAYYPQKL